jgi:hypothetical protein
MTDERDNWRVSSYTGGQGNCVEVAESVGAVLVRDTKNRDGLVLAVSAAAWRRFIGAIS